MPSSSPTEAQTRRTLIDSALLRADWNPADRAAVGQEIPVDGFSPQAWLELERKLRENRLPANTLLPTGISDYVLYRTNGEVLAVVEAKRSSLNPLIAETQAEFYARELGKRQPFLPYVFLTNGYTHYFWDVDRGNKRAVAGFFQRDDLENLLHARQYGRPLGQMQINTSITGRPYQIEAIRRVTEAFDSGKRKALLVMATGTGKTRTVMSLIDLFMGAQQAQRVLFVADRDALVQQAMGEGFQDYLPNEPCTRIFSDNIDKTQRLYAVTLQTLSNCYNEFSPAFFDLIIFDEVHRSIFNRWNEVLSYFDARMMGLTATPADFIDRNTFLEFECPDGIPTYYYGYKQAVQDGYLVDFVLYAAKTRFQRQGIHGVDLSEEERNQLLEQGIDPDNINFAGTELEKSVSNTDTLRKQWEEFWEVCRKDASGQLPGKSIIFAMTQEHAFRLQAVFEDMFPQYPGLAKVITHSSEYKGQALEAFKKEALPRIAISVDMLDTGVNVPEVVNLAFMKPVQSRIKLEQMIGRGTRTQETCTHLEWLPECKKDDFLIIDFWENDFNRQADKDVAQSLPVLVALFNTRLDLLAQTLNSPERAPSNELVEVLRTMVRQIPTDSFLVQRVYTQIQDAWNDEFWQYWTPAKLALLRGQVGPLLRFAKADDVPGATFTHKIERLKLRLAQGQVPAELVDSIRDDVMRLPQFVTQHPEQGPQVLFCLSQRLEAAMPGELNQVIAQLAPQMRHKKERYDNLLVLNLRDIVDQRGYIILTGRNEKVYVDAYRSRVEERVLQQVIGHPTVVAIEQGRPVSDEQLLDLERTLRRELGGDDLELTESNIRKAYAVQVDSLIGFLRFLLELPGLPDYREIVERQFGEYLAEHPFTADQVLFLRAVKSRIISRRRLNLVDLYSSPFTGFGLNALDNLFTPQEQSELLSLANRLAIFQ